MYSFVSESAHLGGEMTARLKLSSHVDRQDSRTMCLPAARIRGSPFCLFSEFPPQRELICRLLHLSQHSSSFVNHKLPSWVSMTEWWSWAGGHSWAESIKVIMNTKQNLKNEWENCCCWYFLKPFAIKPTERGSHPGQIPWRQTVAAKRVRDWVMPNRGLIYTT